MNELGDLHLFQISVNSMFTPVSAKNLITELVEPEWPFLHGCPRDAAEDVANMRWGLTTDVPCWEPVEIDGKKYLKTVNYRSVFENVAHSVYVLDYEIPFPNITRHVRDYLVEKGVCRVFDSPGLVSAREDYALFDRSFFDAIDAKPVLH